MNTEYEVVTSASTPANQETCRHQVTVNPSCPIGAVQCVKCGLVIPATVVRAIEGWIESHRHAYI
jgi:hypothetical protein